MNITFLIGNGFDLNAGLRTQYKQFLEFYCSDRCLHAYAAEAENTQDTAVRQTVVKQFTSLLRADLNYWSAFEAALGRETAKPPLDRQEYFDLCLADFQTEFNEYLKRELARFDWAHSLSDASAHFRTDLLGHMAKLRPGFRQELLSGFGSKIGQNRSYRFISFNYTDVLDRVIRKLSLNDATFARTTNPLIDHKIGQIVHIHGSIDNGMVLGVNDESQIGNLILASQPEFHSSIVKPVVNREFGSGADTNAAQLIDSSDEICIFGMSIGDTDACWWQRIGKWMSADAGHQVILFNHGQNISFLLPQLFHRRETAIKQHFLSQCFPGDDAAQKGAAPQVFVALKTDMFSGVVLRETPSSPTDA